MDKTWLLIGAGAVFFMGVFVYLLFMIFLPEWVGITGKVALNSEKDHQGGEVKESQFWTKMDQLPIEGKDPKSSSPVDENQKGSDSKNS